MIDCCWACWEGVNVLVLLPADLPVLRTPIVSLHVDPETALPEAVTASCLPREAIYGI